MTLVIRLTIIACLVLSFCSLSIAQETDAKIFDRVVADLEAGRTEEALKALDEVIKQHPRLADAYYLRGSLKMQADPTQALSDFDKVIELKPDSGAAYNQRAVLRLVKNDLAGALKDLDSAIAHSFSDDSVYYLRGQLRWQTGELNAALSDLDQAIKLNPNNPRAYSTRGDLLIALKELDRALADYNYLLNWYETDPSARPNPLTSDRNAANSKSTSKAAPENQAKPFLVEVAQHTKNDAPDAKEMAPTIGSVYVNRGLILSSRKNHDAALSDFSKAIRIDPANAWAYYYRANEYELKNDLPAALADIIKAIELERNNGNLRVEHGVILVLMGRDKEAQAVFDVLLRSDQALWQKRIDERLAALKKLRQ